MKDEEMVEQKAEKYAKNLLKDVTCNIGHPRARQINSIDIEDAWLYGYKDGFLAGLKAGRPQWHEVADGDLPKDEKDMLMSEQLILLTKMKGTNNLSISIGQYNFSTQEFSYPHLAGLTDVIAWCEIPTFDKE